MEIFNRKEKITSTRGSPMADLWFTATGSRELELWRWWWSVYTAKLNKLDQD